MLYLNNRNYICWKWKGLRLEHSNVLLVHLSLAVTVISYQCCCRRPVWKLCEISESETGTRRSCHPFSGIHPHSSSTASDLHLCMHLGKRKISELTPLLCKATRKPCARVNSSWRRRQPSTSRFSSGTKMGEGMRQRHESHGYLQLSSSKEQVWESRGKWLKSMLHMAVTVILHNTDTAGLRVDHQLRLWSHLGISSIPPRVAEASLGHPQKSGI